MLLIPNIVEICYTKLFIAFAEWYFTKKTEKNSHIKNQWNLFRPARWSARNWGIY